MFACGEIGPSHQGPGPPAPHCDDSHSQGLGLATRPLKTSSLPVCQSLGLASRPLSPKCPHSLCSLWHGLSHPLPVFSCQLLAPKPQLVQPPKPSLPCLLTRCCPWPPAPCCVADAPCLHLPRHPSVAAQSQAHSRCSINDLMNEGWLLSERQGAGEKSPGVRTRFFGLLLGLCWEKEKR